MKTKKKLLVILLALVMMVSIIGSPALVGNFVEATAHNCDCYGECYVCDLLYCECDEPAMAYQYQRDLYIDWSKYDLSKTQFPNYKHIHDIKKGEICDCDPDDINSLIYFGTWYNEDERPKTIPIKTTYMEGVFKGTGKSSDGLFLEWVSPQKYTGWRHWNITFFKDMFEDTGMDLRDYDAMIIKVKYARFTDGTLNLNSPRRIHPQFTSGDWFDNKNGNPTIDWYVGQLDLQGIIDYEKVQRWTPDWELNELYWTHEVEYRFELRKMTKQFTTRLMSTKAFEELNNWLWEIQIADWVGETDDLEMIEKYGLSGPHMYLGNIYLEKTIPVEPQKGDINFDGKVNGMDLLLMKQHVLNVSGKTIMEDTPKFWAADMNDDGKINGMDLLLLKKKILG